MPPPDQLAVPRRRRIVAVAALAAATLFWAGNYLVGARAVQALDPVALTLWRWVIAVAPLVLIATVVERPDWKRVLAAWRWIMSLALTGLLGYSVLLYGALEHAGALNSSLINAFNPALIALAAAVLLREQLTGTALAGIGVAMVGVLLVISDGQLGDLLISGIRIGDGLMLGAIVAWTAYTILARRAPELPPITSVAAQAVVTILVLLPVTFLTGGLPLPTGPETVASLLFIAIFPSVLSYLLWNHALTVLPAAQVGVSLNLITVFTVVFAIAMGESFVVAQLVGGVVIIAGVILTNWRHLRPPRTTEEVST